MSEDIIRIAAVADVHCAKTTKGALQPIFTAAGSQPTMFVSRRTPSASST